jgi:putative ABC transport system permease protein
MLMVTWLHHLWQDIRYAVRGLAKAPGFLAVALLSLALGIGANTTIFSVLNAVLYRPLPYEHSDRLMVIWQSSPGLEQPPPIAETVDWKKQNHVFEDLALTSEGEQGSFSGRGEPELIHVQDVTPNFFSLLNVQPILGRVFLPEEAQDRTQTVLISSSFWRRRFNGDPNVIGKAFHVSGVISTVVGIVPDFEPFFPEIDLWQPINAESTRYSERADHWLMPVARLKPGVTREQAQVDMDVIARRLEQEYPATNKGLGAKVVPLHEELFGFARQALYPLLGAVAFVLLIACVNVANLLQSRTESRRKEYALRAALGAGRRQLMQQLFAESALLGLVGGGLGVFLSFGGIAIFRALAGDFPNAAGISVDRQVLLFTFSISLLTGLLFGLAPAIQAAKADVNLALRQGGRSTQTGAHGFTHRALAVSEVALAMVLLVGAGLMINTLLRLQRVDPGFDPNHVVTTWIQLPEGGKYVERVPGGDLERATPRVTSFYQQLLQKIAVLPGVQSVGIMNRLPTHGTMGRTFSIVGRAAPPPDKRPETGYDEVSPSVFETLRIPLKRGRYLSEHDTESAPWVVVVNEAFARRYFSDQDPIGQEVLLRYEPYHVDESRPRQIVGIVGDVKHFGLGELAPPFVYTSYLQQPQVYPGGTVTSHIYQELAIRTPTEPRGRATLMSAVKTVVAELDPDQPITSFRTMNQVLARSLDDSRFYMRLLGIFAGVAVLMAGMGVYGVMSYLVSRRTHEIGVRVALGAKRVDVLGLFASMGLKLAVMGVVAGSALSLALTRVIASFLFGVKATDPLTYAAVAAGLIAVALLASYIPARRATLVDPVVALRYQ